MAILDNLESSEFSWDKEFSFEHQNLAVKLFEDTCCNSCSCKSESDHNKWYNKHMTEETTTPQEGLCCSGCICVESHSSKPQAE